MYELDILIKNNWEKIYESKEIKEIDKVIYKLIKQEKGKTFRVLEDNCLLTFVRGNDYDYWYWKNRYVRDKGLNFDYTASYYNYQKKKGNKKWKI